VLALSLLCSESHHDSYAKCPNAKFGRVLRSHFPALAAAFAANWEKFGGAAGALRTASQAKPMTPVRILEAPVFTNAGLLMSSRIPIVR
jgi:hypothetical protein